MLVLVLAACGANPGEIDGGAGGGSGGGAGGGTSSCDATTDLKTNPQHCGSCGHACQFPNAIGSCKAGVCGVKSCAAGFRNIDGEIANGCEASCTPLVVGATGNLDFNVSVIQLSGRVTFNGQSAPAGTPRGSLRFELAGSKPVEVTLPPTGEATFSVKLFAGHYKVSFVKSGDCRTGALPCGTQVVRTGALTASGAMDFNVVPNGTTTMNPTLITITGLVTGNGAALAAGPRGTIRFDAGDAGVTASSMLPGSGNATYSVMIAPGVYDVLVDGDSGCPPNAVLPCQRSVRKKSLSLTSSGNLDLDLPIVQVSGVVTVNGMPVPNDTTERARLKLSDASGEGPSVSLGSAGPATWAARVYPGSYDVRVSRGAQCSPGPLPCQTQKVMSAVPLNATGVLDVDLKVFDVSGQVLANGQLLGSSSNGSSRGRVAFQSNGEGPAIDLGANGASTFQTRLYAGAYDVIVNNATDCPSGALPCGAKKVKSITLNGSGVLDVDVAVIKVSGTLTVNGGPMAISNGPRGALSFEGPATVAVPIGSSGEATWNATLYPGTYRVEFANTANCESGPVPCQKRVLETAHSFPVSGAITWHLPVVEVTGAVTLNGQAVSTTSANARGELLFKDLVYGVAPASLGTTGKTGYRVKLYPSTYQVLFRNTTDCTATDSQPLPCQGEAEVDPAAALTVSGLKDFNLAPVTLSGLVQVNASQMGPSGSGQERGVMRFATFGASTAASRSIGSSGVASYQIRLLPGRYDVGIENVSDCGVNGALPCQKQVLAGCDAP